MEGWKCPVCGRGVAPSEKTCDHGQARASLRDEQLASSFSAQSNAGVLYGSSQSAIGHAVMGRGIPPTDTAIGDVGMIKRAGLGAGHGG